MVLLLLVLMSAYGVIAADNSDQAATSVSIDTCNEPDDAALGELMGVLTYGNEVSMPWAQVSDGSTYWLATSLKDLPNVVVVVSATVGSHGQQIAMNGAAHTFTTLHQAEYMPEEAAAALRCVLDGTG